MCVQVSRSAHHAPCLVRVATELATHFLQAEASSHSHSQHFPAEAAELARRSAADRPEIRRTAHAETAHQPTEGSSHSQHLPTEGSSHSQHLPTEGVRRAPSEALRAATLDGCGALLSLGTEAWAEASHKDAHTPFRWADAPLEDAASIAHAAIAYLQLAALVPPRAHPSSPRPTDLAGGLLALLHLRRSPRHADLLRLHGVVLPLLPTLFSHLSTAELSPLLRDWLPSATRARIGPPWAPLPVGLLAAHPPAAPPAARAADSAELPNMGEPRASAYLRTSRIGRLLPAWLTATAILTACPPLTRLILWELCTTPEVLRGQDKLLIPLLRARCAPAGGLHRLMAHHLDWLVSSWLDHCLPLVASPHHWLHPETSAIY